MDVAIRTPDEFIASLEGGNKEVIETLDKMISKIFKGERRVMWEGTFWGGSSQTIIGYGVWKYTRSDKKEVNWYVIGLSRQKNYFTLNVNAYDGKEQLIPKFEGKLGKVKASKASLNFKKLEDLNLKEIKKLLKIAYKHSR